MEVRAESARSAARGSRPVMLPDGRHGPVPGVGGEAAVVVYLSAEELRLLERLAFLEGVTPSTLASEWVQREIRWLMSVP